MWAREDVLGHSNDLGLEVLDRMVRLDEESRAEAAGSGGVVRTKGHL